VARSAIFDRLTLSSGMDLTIIIVNWNTRELLRNCLRSIREFHDGLSVKTIVVDNKSADGSAEMVEKDFPEMELIRSGGNIGFARANNLAVPKAASEFVLFLNPDTELRADTLRKMVEFLRVRRDVGALGCKIRDASGEYQELGIQRFPTPATEFLRILLFSAKTRKKFGSIFPYHDPHMSGEVIKLFGACLLVRKDVLDKVGSFDERFFMYCEDVDLCQRILAAGWKLYYMSDVEILHLGASASSTAPGQFAVLMTCESFSKLMRKHYGALGSVAYRGVTLGGAQLRLLMLLGMRVLRGANSAVNGSVRKYATTSKWALGLQKPTIRS
jgi:GT2 family glycosyltransferase